MTIIFDNYNEKYADAIEISSKYLKVAQDSAEYFLNKYYKEYALKIEGEFYHGQV